MNADTYVTNANTYAKLGSQVEGSLARMRPAYEQQLGSCLNNAIIFG